MQHYSSFSEFSIDDDLLKALKLLNYTAPTKVQEQVIPYILEHKDVIVKSQTGSGKTAAFAVPICQMADWEQNKPQALILTPTRELALQVKEDIFNIGRFKRLKVAAVYGKSSFAQQERELKQKTHIVVGTPGRLIDHIQRGTLDISQINILVIDEADELLNMGFLEQTETIIAGLSSDRITILLSATMPQDITSLCDQAMKTPVQIEVEEETKAVHRITQEKYMVEQNGKMKLLLDLLTTENPDSSIIFCNTKHQVDEVFMELKALDYSCAKIHGGMEQGHRQSVMNDFRQGFFRYLVATDVAARGIDIEDIDLVINYDLPQEKENYVHRIGRTGRQNKEGKAISFVTNEDNEFLADIQEYIGQKLAAKERPTKDIVKNAEPEFREKFYSVPIAKTAKGEQLGTEIMKLHINAGKKTKMRAVDIVGTLSNIPGMTAADIGIINILDVSSYVEVLNNKGELVFQALQNTPIKGRLRKVSKVKSRS